MIYYQAETECWLSNKEDEDWFEEPMTPEHGGTELTFNTPSDFFKWFDTPY